MRARSTATIALLSGTATRLVRRRGDPFRLPLPLPGDSTRGGATHECSAFLHTVENGFNVDDGCRVKGLKVAETLNRVGLTISTILTRWIPTGFAGPATA